MSTVKRLIHMLGRYSVLMVLSILLAAASVILTLYVPIIFGDAIDNIVENGVNLGAVAKYLTKAGIVAASAALMQ